MPARSETREINAFLTTTMQEYETTLQDNIFDDVPALSYMNGKLGRVIRGRQPTEQIKKVLNGGERIKTPLLYGKNDTAGSYAGAEQLSTNIQDGITDAFFDWAQYSVSISITGIQKRSNSGTYALIDLLGAKATQAEMSLQELMNLHLWESAVGNGGKNINGLPLMVDNSASLGGISPTTNTWWKSGITSSVGAFLTSDTGVKKMRNMYNTLTIGNRSPDLIITTQAIYEDYEHTGVDDRRYTSNKVVDAGFETLLFKTKPIVFDRDCPSGEMYFLNSNHITWYVHRDADMKMTADGFVTPFGQDVSAALILFQGNATINNRRRCGKLTGITTS